MRQEVREGTQGLEEVDTYEMLDKLRPERRDRCRKGQKAVGRACCDRRQTATIEFDERVGIAISRAANYLRTLPERLEEVRQAADIVLRTARALERRGQ
jgi:hypothetical protein